MAIKILTLKIQGQGHGWGKSLKSQLGSNILWIHTLLCQSILLFLWYTLFFFWNLTFKILGQSHSSRSHNRYTIISHHIPFIPCWSALPFLRCSYLKKLPSKSKVKVMGDVKAQSHNVSLTSYWLTSLSFHIILASHCWVTTFSKFELEIQGSRSLVRSQFKVTMWV